MTKQEIADRVCELMLSAALGARELSRATQAGQTAPGSIAKLRRELVDMLSLVKEFGDAEAETWARNLFPVLAQ